LVCITTPWIELDSLRAGKNSASSGPRVSAFEYRIGNLMSLKAGWTTAIQSTSTPMSVTAKRGCQTNRNLAATLGAVPVRRADGRFPTPGVRNRPVVWGGK
jgi:hypothetical protein